MHHVFKITATEVHGKSVIVTVRNIDTDEKPTSLVFPILIEPGTDKTIALAKLKRLYSAARVLFGEDLDQLVGQTFVGKEPDRQVIGSAADAIRSFTFTKWLATRKAHDNDRGDVIRKARRIGLSTFGAVNAVSTSPRAKKAARRLWREYMRDRDQLRITE